MMRRFFRLLPTWLQILTVVVGIPAGLITIGGFAYWIYIISTTDDEMLSFNPMPVRPPLFTAEPFAVPVASPSVVNPQPTAVPTPAPTPTITPTPTPIPPLGEHLERALSIYSSTSQGEGLASVAAQAILLGDYWTAIRAADATPSTSKQADNLELVVRCAIEDGRFSMATEAASRAANTKSQGRLMIMALEAQEAAIERQVSSPSIPSTQLPQNRNLSCLKTDEE